MNELLGKTADAYFEPKFFESTSLYEKLGVRGFKRHLPWLTGDLVRQRITGQKHIDGLKNEGSLHQFRTFTRQAEAFHASMIPAIYIGTELCLDSVDSNLLKSGVMLATNLVANVYPIMTQRYNRIRLNNAIDRFESKNTNAHNAVIDSA